ncbi:unnamed protein product [Acanthoscelides obtectus]|uniref:Uncharacterized protein n=1 Tax=Acanthoscelides obtectus TaxID=200917 RepID=A0A9P0JSJ3_ACAOB|nr:unnamed protein product [Acanthoscelides obtectus]CAK1625485.1 hypothetical protein AOBTE_LOCUS3190 [Acanthoscelides obtectus]
MENYESCIRIKGLHILPPVITEKRRIELQRYKQQAIKLEKRLQNCRKLKRNLEELMQVKLPSHQEKPVLPETIKTLNLSADIVNITEFSSDGIKVWSGNECVHKKESVDTIPSSVNQIVDSKSKEENESSKEDLQDKADSSTDTFELSPSLEKSSQASSNIFRKTDLDQLDPEPEKESISTETCSNISDFTSQPRPRLIRSNSYTLEAPSPILLAHLEKTNKGIETQNDLSQQNLARNWTSLEDNYIPFERSAFSSMDTVLNADDLSCSENKIKESRSPQVAVVQTDISVQHISVRGEEGDEKRLMEVLDKIPEAYSKQILELIEKHFGSLNAEKTTQQVDKTITEHSEKEESCAFLEENHVDTNHSDASNENSYTPQVHKNVTVRKNSSPAKMEYFPGGQKMTTTYVEQKSFDRSKAVIPAVDSCILRRRRLSFPNDNPPHFSRSMNIIRREWAARVICAHARGYLTRRLLKTERVQSLIMTIKDALMCALQLHSADNINEADVELHRRLINQVKIHTGSAGPVFNV